MAVLEAHPGLKTEITVGRRPLVEHNDDEADATPTMVTKYIEAHSGADLAIKTTFSEPFPVTNGVEIKVKVDGNRGPCWAIKPDDRFYRSASKMTGVSFTQNGMCYHQNYQFSTLNIVEEAEGPLDIQALRKEVELKGCIEVSYRWITDFRTRAEPETPTTSPDAVAQLQSREEARVDIPLPRRQLPSVDAIPEKALKGDARSHQAVLGEPKAKKASTGPGSTYSYVDREPFGIMYFKYRSLAALKALRVIIDAEARQESGPLQVEEPREEGSNRTRLSLSLHRTHNEQDGAKREPRPHHMKQEDGPFGRVKRELDAAPDANEDSDEITVVGTRSCKRPHVDQELIVLD